MSCTVCRKNTPKTEIVDFLLLLFCFCCFVFLEQLVLFERFCIFSFWKLTYKILLWSLNVAFPLCDYRLSSPLNICQTQGTLQHIKSEMWRWKNKNQILLTIKTNWTQMYNFLFGYKIILCHFLNLFEVTSSFFNNISLQLFLFTRGLFKCVIQKIFFAGFDIMLFIKY